MIGLAFLAQAVALAFTTPMDVQVFLCAALIAFALDGLWRMRRLFNPHLDMILIMLSWGGIGMLLPAVATQTPPCHGSFASMWTGMLALSAWPAYRYARCLQAARQENRLAITLAFDLSGMAAGMLLPIPAVAPWLHHTTMLLAMTLGMGAGMLALRRVLRPQVPANS